MRDSIYVQVFPFHCAPVRFACLFLFCSLVGSILIIIVRRCYVSPFSSLQLTLQLLCKWHIYSHFRAPELLSIKTSFSKTGLVGLLIPYLLAFGGIQQLAGPSAAISHRLNSTILY